MATLEAIRYTRGSLDLLDQRLLPTQTVFLRCPDTRSAFDHIRAMVRYPVHSPEFGAREGSAGVIT